MEALSETREKLGVALWAYVIMPEHVHVLLYPLRNDYSIHAILAILKRSVSAKAREHLEKTRREDWLTKLSVRFPSRTVFRFWQPGGGFDKNIFKERTVASVIEYIHDNPVRRGLVDHPSAWEWSSARFWLGRQDVPIRMDPPFV